MPWDIKVREKNVFQQSIALRGIFVLFRRKRVLKVKSPALLFSHFLNGKKYQNCVRNKREFFT